MLQGIGFKSKLTIIYKIEKEQRNNFFYSVPKLYASLVLEKKMFNFNPCNEQALML